MTYSKENHPLLNWNNKQREFLRKMKKENALINEVLDLIRNNNQSILYNQIKDYVKDDIFKNNI